MDFGIMLSYTSLFVAIIVGVGNLATILFVTIPSRNISKLQAAITYFQQYETRDFRKCRERLAKANVDSINPDDAREVCSFFHFWGLMVEKKHLPIWIFDGPSGQRVIQSHKRLSGFIKEVQKETDNERYGEKFKWLSDEIVKKGWARL